MAVAVVPGKAGHGETAPWRRSAMKPPKGSWGKLPATHRATSKLLPRTSGTHWGCTVTDFCSSLLFFFFRDNQAFLKKLVCYSSKNTT